MIKIIALDPGYGSTKVAMDHLEHCGYHVTLIQSSVCRPSHIGQAAIGMSTASGTRLVQFDDHEFCVGASAWNWGRSLNNMDYSSLASPEHQALFYGALANMLPSDGCDVRSLIVGLPVPLLLDHEQANQVLERLKNMKGDHKFSVDGASYQISIERVKVLSQPVGTYANWLLGLDHQPIVSRMTGEAAVLDIGRNTLDLYVIRGGEVSPRYVGGEKLGVRRLLEMIAGPSQELDEVDAGLRDHLMIPPPAILQGWLQELMGAVERTWPSLRRFSAVLPTGGGVVVLGDMLRQELITRGAAVYWPEDPVNANVIGLWKWATHVFNRT